LTLPKPRQPRWGGASRSSNANFTRAGSGSRLQEVVSEIESGSDGNTASGAVRALELPADVRRCQGRKSGGGSLAQRVRPHRCDDCQRGMALTTDASELDLEELPTT